MHVAGSIELAHGCVDDGIASATLTPSSEEVFIVLPLDITVFGLEGFVHTFAESVIKDLRGNGKVYG